VIPETEPHRQADAAIIATPDGRATRLDLMLGGESVSWLWIVPFTLCIGQARVRMDGIGGVGTKEEHRNRGYSRRVLEAAVERMRAGDAALSMLYGIRDFYPKFGYATAGPDHYFVLKDLSATALPHGWQARVSEEHDLRRCEGYTRGRPHAAPGQRCASQAPGGDLPRKTASRPIAAYS